MWPPRSEDDIDLAIANGTQEDHYLDFKDQVGPSVGARKELAGDIAQFALDGGMLIIGVKEDKTSRTFSKDPFLLNGVKESFEQVANARISPHLPVRIREIPTNADSARGFVVIEVDPSPRAPHMVENIYYGRGNDIRRRLNDEEVRRFHSRSKDWRDEVNRLLDIEISRDPIDVSDRQHAHLYLVAQPQIGDEELAVDLLSSSNVRDMLRGIVTYDGEAAVDRDWRGVAPGPGYASSLQRRAGGVAYSSLSAGRIFDPSKIEEANVIDIEVREDAGLRVLMARMTYQSRNEAHIQEGLATAYVTRLLTWARRVSEEVGYNGTWLLGVAITGVNGKTASRAAGSFHAQWDRYSEDEYRRASYATVKELTESPDSVVGRLIDSFLRALGADRTPRPIGNYQE